MREIFLWFYCLPMIDSIMLILLATAVFLYVQEKFHDSPYWKPSVCLLFFIWLAVIYVGTLGNRTEGGNFSQPNWALFASYQKALDTGNKEIYRTNFMNAVLFYPAGLFGCAALPKRWKWGWKVLLMTVVLMLASAGIEYVQYRFHMGLAETDDIIHNSLGVLLGATAWGIPIKRAVTADLKGVDQS